MKSDERRLKILEYVVDHYIQTGEPVGSGTIAAMMGYAVSSATIRNDMAALDRLGFLEQPHTSAGRIPTYIGYRMYINQLMKPSLLTEEEKQGIYRRICEDTTSVSAVVENALDALAETTGCAVVGNARLPEFSVITKVEVLPTGRRIYAVLMITSTGEIKNKVCRLQFDLTQEQIAFFEDLVNKELRGMKLDAITPDILQELSVALGSYIVGLSPLLYTLYQLSDEIAKDDLTIKGETNLLQCADFEPDSLLRFMNTKHEIANILESALSGVNVIFGNETDTFAISNSSLILSKADREDDLGTFGVIGPIRLDYSKVIPYVEYVSESMRKVVHNILEEDLGKEEERDD